MLGTYWFHIRQSNVLKLKHMKKKNLPFLVLFLFFSTMIVGYGCSSGKKNGKKDQKMETAKQDTARSQKQSMKDFKKMSPDHAAVKGRVLMFNENKPEGAVIKIDEVLGYGSGTPMLAAGQEINVSLSNTASSDTTKGTDINSMLTSGKSMIFVLSHIGQHLVMGSSKKNLPEWRIENIEQ